jgi:dienelactone hydrolase
MRRWSSLRLLAVVSLGVATLGCGTDDDQRAGVCPPDGCTTESDDGVEYAADADLDVIAPTEPGRWPVVVVMHYLSGSRHSMTPLATAIAEGGAVVYNATVPDDPPFLETLEYLACAVRYARRTAKEHHGDAAPVTLVGVSLGAWAGGLVALDGDHYDSDACVADDEPVAVDAVVAYEGPYDLATSQQYPLGIPELEATEPGLWSEIDPYQHLGGNPDLVIRLIHGLDEDRTWGEVHPEVSDDFSRALDDAGYDVELTWIDDAFHIPSPAEFDAIVDLTIAVS